jgi:hypothetical protein
MCLDVRNDAASLLLWFDRLGKSEDEHSRRRQTDQQSLVYRAVIAAIEIGNKISHSHAGSQTAPETTQRSTRRRLPSLLFEIILCKPSLSKR